MDVVEMISLKMQFLRNSLEMMNLFQKQELLLLVMMMEKPGLM